MWTRLRADTLAIVALAAFVGLGSAQTQYGPMRLSAWAINMTGGARASTATMDITIDRWSTAEERQQLIETLLQKDQDALLKALRKAPVKGRMRIPGYMGPDPHQWRLGNDLRYAWQTPGEDGGTRIVIATDRYIGFWEARNQPRTTDYPFTFLEIHLNAEGEGEGKMAVAMQLRFDKGKNLIEMENYGIEPVRLQQVRIVKTS